MLKITNTEVMGIEGAIRGMRNAMNSWNKADSIGIIGDYDYCDSSFYDVVDSYLSDARTTDEVDEIKGWLYANAKLKQDNDYFHAFLLGKNDLALAQKLISAGAASHRKFLRQIFVSFDVDAPMYW